MQNHTSSSSKTRDVLLKDVDKLKQDAVQVAKDVRNHATAHVDETKQRVNDTLQNFQNELTTHPFTVLGVGFALGFLFGLRFSR